MVEKPENEDVQASIMAQGNSETICVSVETPRTSSAPQQTENKESLNMNSWALVFMTSCFMVLILHGARAFLISDFQRGTSGLLCGLPSEPSLPSNTTHSSTHAFTLTAFRDKDLHWDIAMHWWDPTHFFPLWKLSVWWNGGVCRRQERSHFKPWGLQLSDLIGLQDWKSPFIISFFRAWIHKFCKSDLKIWALKVTGRMLGIRTSMALWAKTGQIICPLELNWAIAWEKFTETFTTEPT